MPIPMKVIGATAIVAAPWCLLMLLLHVPLSNPWYLIWVTPPIFAGYISTREIFQRKTLLAFIKSQLKYYLFQPKQINGITRGTPSSAVTRTPKDVEIRIFTRNDTGEI